jgi:prepilin peptidase CpaA
MTIPEAVRQGALYGIATLLTAVLAYAAVNDVRERKIPNWTVLACLGLFVAWALVHPLNWDFWALGAGVVAFLITFALYMGGVIGAGDSKLFAVVALFTGMGQLAILALATAVIGGLVAIAGFVIKPTRGLVMLKMRGQGDFGRGVPYGVAIAVASGALVWAAALGAHLPGYPG